MFRIIGCASLLLAAAAAFPAAAQSWSFGFGTGFGGPVYVEPPPVYYGAPVYAPEPGVIYREAPGVLTMQAPELVFDRLEAAGYSEFSPMARRGNLYRLNAVDPSGNLVALDISIFTGEIERARMLEARFSAPPPKVAPKPRRKAAAKPPRVPRTAAPRPTAAAPAPAPVDPAPEAAAPPPPAPPSGDEPSTLRERLETPPGEPAPPAEGSDPEVVY